MADAPDTEHAEAEPEDGVAEGTEPVAAVAFGCPLTLSTDDQRVLHPNRDQWLLVASAILADGFRMCIDVTAVDYLTNPRRPALAAGVAPERFEVVASFMNHARRERIRARIQVPEGDPTIPSLTTLYPGADYLEREVFDMFGVVFEGHPDLSRILMPENWEGHPLRKDYATGAIPVQFKGTN